MASRKKPGRNRREVDASLGTLADAFGDKLKDVETSGEGPTREEQERELRGLERVEADRRRHLADNPSTRQVTQRELMAEAFEAIDSADPAAKFVGAGYDAGDVEVVDEPGRERKAETPPPEPADGMTSDDLLFVEMMAGNVDPLEKRDKYAALREHAFTGIRWHDEVQLERMTAEELHEPAMTGAQRKLLQQARRAAPIPVLNVRYLRKHEALGDVDAFVRACQREGHRYARIVHGKGRQSEGDPVLKPAVVNWCRHDGASLVRAWAPETDLSGQFGSLVIELTRSRS